MVRLLGDMALPALFHIKHKQFIAALSLAWGKEGRQLVPFALLLLDLLVVSNPIKVLLQLVENC